MGLPFQAPAPIVADDPERLLEFHGAGRESDLVSETSPFGQAVVTEQVPRDGSLPTALNRDLHRGLGRESAADGGAVGEELARPALHIPEDPAAGERGTGPAG